MGEIDRIIDDDDEIAEAVKDYDKKMSDPSSYEAKEAHDKLMNISKRQSDDEKDRLNEKADKI